MYLEEWLGVNYSFLLVDDAICMRMKMKLLLQRAFKAEVIEEASNGQEAVDKFKKCRPDIIIMDITMPVMDGLTALKEIKKIDANATVVMVTAMGKEGLVVEAVMAGARDYIVKPYTDERVITTLEKIIGQPCT